MIRFMFLIAMYYISGSLFIKDIRGGAIFLQIDRTFSVSLTKSKYLRMTFEAERTTAELECAKLGITL